MDFLLIIISHFLKNIVIKKYKTLQGIGPTNYLQTALCSYEDECKSYFVLQLWIVHYWIV